MIGSHRHLLLGEADTGIQVLLQEQRMHKGMLRQGIVRVVVVVVVAVKMRRRVGEQRPTAVVERMMLMVMMV